MNTEIDIDTDVTGEIVRTCPTCGTEIDVSERPYIYIGYHLRPDDGGFCCSSDCAHEVIEANTLD